MKDDWHYYYDYCYYYCCYCCYCYYYYYHYYYYYSLPRDSLCTYFRPYPPLSPLLQEWK